MHHYLETECREDHKKWYTRIKMALTPEVGRMPEAKYRPDPEDPIKNKSLLFQSC